MDLAEQGGFAAVRLRDIAARSDVALGTLYARFRGKDDILLAALELATEAFEELLNQDTVTGDTPQRRVEVFFGIASQALFSRPRFAQAVLRATASGDPGVAPRVIGYQQRIGRLIVAAIRGKRPDAVEKQLDPGDPNTQLATMLQSLWFAALVGWVSGTLTEDDVMQQMRRAVHVVGAGLGVY